jgi:hypothetical protein
VTQWGISEPNSCIAQNFLFVSENVLPFSMSQPNTFQHKFTYTAPEAKSVLVTGTFDQWSKTQTLTHVADGVFTGTVSIPYQTPGQAIYYKYVVDEQWVTDDKTETKNDESGNLNNIIYAPTEPVKKSTEEAPAGAAAGVGAGAAAGVAAGVAAGTATSASTGTATGAPTGTATTQASAQGQQLPPLFVPPVVLPSDKAAYQGKLQLRYDIGRREDYLFLQIGVILENQGIY